MHRPALSVLLLSVAMPAAATQLIDFDELSPAHRPDYNTSGGFITQGNAFTGAPYSGWSYSDDADTTTPGFSNQYAAITGGGVGGAGNYAVASGNGSFINLAPGETPTSAYVTNTTYAALSMEQGDPFAKKFGGVSGDDPDRFSVTFTGYAEANGSGSIEGSTEFVLADFTSADNAMDYIVKSWQLVDLTALGAARSIGLTFASTDTSTYGTQTYVNTPAYIALDSLATVPEPLSAAVLTLGGLLLIRRR